MQYVPQTIRDKSYKLSELAIVEKSQTPQQIAKVNQQYRLCLQYEYIGASSQGEKIQKRELREFNKILPMGYTAKAEKNYWSWDQKDNKQYALLFLIIVIIFFTTSILFNSLKTTAGGHFCHTDLLYRGIPDLLLVQTELRPRWIRLLRFIMRYHGKRQYLYLKRI